MPRRSRLHLVNVPQHIIQRGNNRQAIFFAEEDYSFYFERLGEGARNTETYLLRCCRYIECNPVRAQMVLGPGEYRWSSYRHHAFGVQDKLLTVHEQYSRLGSTDEVRQSAYRELFRTELDSKELAEIRSAANCGWPLGSDRFKDEIERALSCAVRPPKPGRPPKNRTTTPRAEQKRAYYRAEKLH